MFWTSLDKYSDIASTLASVIRTLYYNNRDLHRFLQSNDSVKRVEFHRIFLLASIDVIFTLPVGIVVIVLTATDVANQVGDPSNHTSWTFSHTDWEPISVPYRLITQGGPLIMAEEYLSAWLSPVLAYLAFGLFGVTSEVRATCWRALRNAGDLLGSKQKPRARQTLSTSSTMKFAEQSQGTTFNFDLG